VLAPADRWLGATVGGTDAQVPVAGAGSRGERAAAWQGVEHVTLPADGVEVELRFRGEDDIELWLWDGGPGIGAAGDALLRARPEWAVPIHRGDRTLTMRRLVIAAPSRVATP
jgi:hypothetical protein